MARSNTPFLNDARKRAEAVRAAQNASFRSDRVHGHPLQREELELQQAHDPEQQQHQHQHQQERRLLSRAHHHNLSPEVVVRTPINGDKARMEWRRYGDGVSQASEEKRRPQSSADTVVRILAVETRSDVNGSPFSSYVISVFKPDVDNSAPILVEHRYSDFDKLNSLIRKHNVQLGSVFPSKHWAGRIGNWTPSLSLAPNQHHDLISYRKIQLDLWLVDLVAAYNRGQLPSVVQQEVTEFLSGGSRPPCDRDNDFDVSTSMKRSLRLSNPLSFTLGSSIRQASCIVQYMCRRGLSESDQSIPLDLIHQAKGLCFLTVMKAGVVVSGKIGTGLVVSRKVDGTWSAPSALGTVGLGWGAQIGGDITHYLIVLTSRDAVESFTASSSVTLGAELGVAVGPVGRGATSHISSSSLLKPAYAYAHSQGLFVGISLEGGIVNTRHDLNAKFYGRHVEVEEILKYMTAPRAAQPLYDALNDALAQDIPEDGIRPSTLFSSSSFDSTPVKHSSPITSTKLSLSSPELVSALTPSNFHANGHNLHPLASNITLPSERFAQPSPVLSPGKF